MIFEFILDIVKDLLFGLLDFIQLPEFPVELTSAMDTIIEQIFSSARLVGLAIRWDTVVAAAPVLIAIVNMQHIYNGIMWILKKIPMLGIE